MLVLKLVPTPASGPPVHTPVGRGALRVTRSSPLDQPKRMLTLGLRAAINGGLLDDADGSYLVDDADSAVLVEDGE